MRLLNGRVDIIDNQYIIMDNNKNKHELNVNEIVTFRLHISRTTHQTYLLVLKQTQITLGEFEILDHFWVLLGNVKDFSNENVGHCKDNYWRLIGYSNQFIKIKDEARIKRTQEIAIQYKEGLE